MRQKFFDPQNGLKTQKKAFFFFGKILGFGFSDFGGSTLGQNFDFMPENGNLKNGR